MIEFFLSNIPFEGLIIALIISCFKRPFAKTLTLYLLLLPIGLGSLWAAAYHAFAPTMAAELIGWQPSPFQSEIAAANFGLGLAGTIAFWRKSWDFCVAVAIVAICLLWGAGLVHVYGIVAQSNLAPNNAGAMLWSDVLTPLFLLSSLILWKKTGKA